jgi:hypothetical protein
VHAVKKPITTPWRPPTRRTFVAMLGLGVAALAVRTKRSKRAPVAQSPTRWIGHC